MTPKEQKILAALTAQKEPVTAETLAEGLDYDAKNLTKSLNSMSKAKLILKEGTGKTALFKILDEEIDPETLDKEVDPEILDKPINIGNDFLDEEEKEAISDLFEERFPLAQVANDMCTTPCWVKGQCKLKGLTIHAQGLTAKEILEINPAD